MKSFLTVQTGVVKQLLPTLAAIGAACDLMITGAMVWLLLKGRSGAGT
jgi:hypothetical protein